LLAEPGQSDFGQAFDGVIERIDAGLRQDIEAPIAPLLVDVRKGVGLGVLPVFRFKEIADDERVGLVGDLRLDVEVGAKVCVVGKIKPLPVRRDGVAAEGVDPRLLVMGVIIFDGPGTELTEVIEKVRANSQAAFFPPVRMQGPVQMRI